MFYREQQRQRELAEYAHLSEEVQRGVRILLDLTTTLHSGTTAPFMERVDAVRDGAPDYYQVFFFCFLCPFFSPFRRVPQLVGRDPNRGVV